MREPQPAKGEAAALRLPASGLPVARVLGVVVLLFVAGGALDALLLLSRAGLAPPGLLALAQVAFRLAALMGLVGLACALLAAPALLLLARTPGLARRLPDLVFGALGLAGVAAAGYVLIRRPSWEAIDLRLQLLFGFFVLGGVVLRFSLRRPERLRRLPGPSLLLGVALVVLTAAQVMLPRPLASLPVQDAIVEHSIFGPPLARAIRRLADRDRDGFPVLLCGRDCDCDDARRDVNPAALDPRGDGLDSDCDGADGVAEVPVPVPPAGSTRSAPVPPGLPVAAPAGAASAEGGLAGPAGADSGASGLDPAAGAAGEVLTPALTAGSATSDTPGACTPGGGPCPAAAAEPSTATLPDAAPSAARPNIILISVDTLRADHLAAYGYPRATSPNLDRLAQTGVLFEQARSQGAMTRFSVPSMVTGRYHTELRRTGGKWPVIDESNRPLGVRFAQLGYATALVSCHFYFLQRYGLSAGFEVVNTKPAFTRTPFHQHITGDLVTAEARDLLPELARRQPFLLWLHYGDPHSDYQSHEGAPKWGSTWKDLYDQEVFFSDQQIALFLDALRAVGLAEASVVFVTGDHGEGLVREEDHGKLYHGQTLYDNLVRVPLIVAGPGVQPQRVRDRAVGLIDLLPTFLDLARAPHDPTLRGQSLLPFLRGANPEHPPVFAEKPTEKEPPKKSMVQWPYKLIWDLGTNRFRLYDLLADPGELSDLYGQDPARDAALVARIKAWRAEGLAEVPSLERL